MKFILGTKEKMTQIFDNEGNAIPVTLVSAGPIVATQIKTKEKDGYEAIQFGFGKRNLKNINKPQKHLGENKYIREYITKKQEEIKKGDKFTVEMFEEGDNVIVSGISKGKGFQGVVKRHGFKGGPRTHGQKHSEREPGSIGGGGRAGGRVVKGMRMAGRMGGDRITVKNLKIVKIDKENNQLLISGAIPGRKGTLLEIRS